METGVRKQISARKLTILSLLSAPDANTKTAQPILGTTRMQKLVFLVSERTRLALKDNTYFNFDFNYEAEKFGPADLDLYQDLDFLRTMRLITWDRGEVIELSPEPLLEAMVKPAARALALLPEEREEDELSFEYLMGVDPLELLVADAETEGEPQYAITEKGFTILDNLRSSSEGRQKELFEALENACTAVRQEYGHWALKRLLKYIYDNYSSLTTKSIIRSQVEGTR
ncbi:MAG: hypothetical protein ISS54_04140 [Dehalococcoidia bacterium]|nr:hypothetical protein [Dehalococcoidia bacterium]